MITTENNIVYNDIRKSFADNQQGSKVLWQKTLKLITQEFEKSLDGTNCAKQISKATDMMILGLLDRLPSEVKFSIIAVGGYGRGLNAPYSDIDIIFLCDGREKHKQQIENILYQLWDIGAKIGYSVYTTKTLFEDISSDSIFLTSALTSRFICGDKILFDAFVEKFKNDILPFGKYEYVSTKMTERKLRHLNYGSSKYVLEPNVKEGKGALRDLYTLLWITGYVYEFDNISDLRKQKLATALDEKKFEESKAFLWRVRIAMHIIAGKAEETLSFNMQLKLAEILGYKDTPINRGVELFMRDYYHTLRTTGILTRAFIIMIEEDINSTHNIEQELLESTKFKLLNNRLAVIDINLFYNDKLAIIELFSIAESQNLKLHSQTFRLAYNYANKLDDNFCKNVKVNEIFLSILMGKKNPERILRLMNETGILEKIIPEWSVISCQMQYNMYHSYTTDEHTIRAIGILHKIDNKKYKEDHPLCNEILSSMSSKTTLYVAVLLHDIAKGLDGDHSILGAEIARRVCPRLGLDIVETEAVCWLIENHLIMSNTSQRRDINDNKTSEDFARIVGTVSMLDMLTVLTVVDTRAVGQHVWNNWKRETIQRLYSTTYSRLSGSGGEDVVYAQVEKVKQHLSKQLRDRDRIDELLESITTSYALSDNIDNLTSQCSAVLSSDEFCVKISNNEECGYSRIFIHTADKFGLMADLTGMLTILGANMFDAQIHTLGKFGAFNTFRVRSLSGGLFDKDEEYVSKKIKDAILGNIDLSNEINKRRSILKTKGDSFKIASLVTLNNKASHTSTLIEIKTKDSIGLLYELSRAILDLGLKIQSSKITTYGERAVDVFYVRDAYGFKLRRKQTQSTIVKKLTEFLKDLKI